MNARWRAKQLYQKLLLTCMLVLCVYAAPPVLHVPNFDQVNDKIYRGGEPSLIGLQELGASGVKLVIDLREKSQATEFEKKEVEKLGMQYVNIPFREFSAPTNEQVQKVLSLLTSEYEAPVFVHCRRGKDRTGTVIACYRIQHDGWDHQRALAEAQQHGMSMFERGMRGYILHFAPGSP